MQKEFNENLSKIYQCLTKPFCELTELNINTLNNIIKDTNSFGTLGSAKTPEDILAAQVKLASIAYLEVTQYHQKLMEIGIDSLSYAGKIWGDSLNDATNKAFNMAKTGSTGKSK